MIQVVECNGPDGQPDGFSSASPLEEMAMEEAVRFTGLSDNGAIDRSDRCAMLAWARILGVFQEQVLIAVAVVGPRYDHVRDYLTANAK